MPNKSVTLSVVIAGDPRGATGAFRAVDSSAKSLTTTTSKLGGALVGFLAGGTIVRAGAQAIGTYRTVGNELLRLQRLSGASDQRTSGLYVWAQQSGVAVDKLGTSLGILSSNIKSGKAEKLGIDLKDAHGQAIPLDQALQKIADRIASMDNAGERNALARGLLGRGGTELLPMLLRGGDALDEFTAKAKQLGIELNSDDIREANKNQRDFALASRAAGYVVGKELLPPVLAFTKWGAQELPKVVGFATSTAHAFNLMPGPVKATVAALLLAGPAVKVLGFVATPVKQLFSLASGGRTALAGFSAGLKGIETEGAGAANSMGRFLGSLSTGELVAGGIALAGFGVVLEQTIGYFVRASQEAAQTKANIQSMADEVVRSGKTIDEVFSREALVKFYRDNAAALQATGVSLEDVSKAVRGSKSEWEAFWTSTSNKGFKTAGGHNNLPDALTQLRTQYTGLAPSVKALTEAEDTFGISADDATSSIDGQTAALDPLTKALNNANKALEDQISKRAAIRSAEEDVAQADRDRLAAIADLAKAEREATGDSDEYRQAEQATAEAHAAEAEAARGVEDALRSQADARAALNKELVDARQRILDLAAAVREANTAEAGDELAVERARKELERVNASGADALTKKEAAQALREAEDKYAASVADRQQKEKAAADAQRLGVEGDAQVIAARQRLSDANQGVVDAERKVQDAQAATAEAGRRQAQVLVDAKARVREASKKVEDATFNEADAIGKLGEAQGGAARGVDAHRKALLTLADMLKPDDPLRARLRELAAELAADAAAADDAYHKALQAAGLGGLTGLGQLAAGAVGGITDGIGQGAGGGLVGNQGNLLAGGSDAGGNGVTVEDHSVTNNISLTTVAQGTPRQQRRAMRQEATDTFDDAFRKARG